MYYQGIVVQLENRKFHAAILKLTCDEPGCDTIMEFESNSKEEAYIWLDDEMSRLVSGKGLWDI